MKNWILILIASCGLTAGIAQSNMISGYVFLDANINGIYDKGETPLPNVFVSNGLDVVKSDGLGKYEIKLIEDRSVFVMKPSGFIPGVTHNNISRFFAHHSPSGSPQYKYAGIPKTTLKDQLNFAMYPNPGEDTLKIALLGDTQVETIDDVYYVARLVGEQLVEEEVDFVVPLGDLVFDDLNLFDPLKKVLGKIGAPVYYVYGNHDRNYDAMQLQYRDETYEANFGPSYHAFNYGDHAFFVLNNIYPEHGTRNFEARIDEDQLQFFKNYLKMVPFENTDPFIHAYTIGGSW